MTLNLHRIPFAVVVLILSLVVPGPGVGPAGAERQRQARAARKPARSVKKAPARKPPPKKVLKAQLTVTNQKIKQAKAELTGVKQEIQDAQAELQIKEAQVARISDQIRLLAAREQHAKKRLKGATRRLEIAERQVAEVKVRLKRAELRLAAHRRRLGVRIRRSYTAGTVTFADVLLQATSLSDFLDRQYYVERIFSSDLEFLNQLREEQRVVDRTRLELEAKRDEQALAKEEMALQVREVQTAKAQRQELLEKVENDKALKEQELLELQQDSSSIAALLASEWQRRVALWRQIYQGRVPMPGWGGKWLRPVPYPISSGFGMRFHPILGYHRMHTGIDFAAPEGTPIRAAAPGDVIWASWRGGYGRCIILLHGGGVSTLYAHCSAIDVYVGQKVKRGETIGYTGTTGLSTGPHLHFEMRNRHGVPVDPIGR